MGRCRYGVFKPLFTRNPAGNHNLSLSARSDRKIPNRHAVIDRFEKRDRRKAIALSLADRHQEAFFQTPQLLQPLQTVTQYRLMDRKEKRNSPRRPLDEANKRFIRLVVM